ncbi:DNA-binding GntR family transcriptional regulator [Ilumatobacter fluminis]|uniref:DNA-binding GntR family transcriptional regulator n=1 Tax=Ilumatobacter fluminis TaxID=467091 RepID=A0A4R7HXR9_9ACTN|nr:GntR family transcriptional regulator [Ilumatobacter fluminis]TDT15865.1 DNA-binding GntR family transcriptional regulator [Ilumatobacter fluminis]
MSNRKGDNADSSLSEIRKMILTGELLPGEKVNQGEIADRLGVSRIPVREALGALVTEGLLDHWPNTGYTVVRPTVEDLSEIYLMRQVLEAELFRSVDLAALDPGELEAVNDELRELGTEAGFYEYREANRRFHFAIFDRSPLRLVLREVRRLWILSEFYHSLYFRHDGATEQVLADHDRIIEAVRQRDQVLLVEASADHREGTKRSMTPSLSRRPTRSETRASTPPVDALD